MESFYFVVAAKYKEIYFAYIGSNESILIYSCINNIILSNLISIFVIFIRFI